MKIETPPMLKDMDDKLLRHHRRIRALEERMEGVETFMESTRRWVQEQKGGEADGGPREHDSLQSDVAEPRGDGCSCRAFPELDLHGNYSENWTEDPNCPIHGTPGPSDSNPVNLTNDVSLVRNKGDTSGQHGAGDADSTSGAQDGLVERVVDALREAYGDCDPCDTLAAYRVIREVADALGEAFPYKLNPYSYVNVGATVSTWLRAQLED